MIEFDSASLERTLLKMMRSPFSSEEVSSGFLTRRKAFGLTESVTVGAVVVEVVNLVGEGLASHLALETGSVDCCRLDRLIDSVEHTRYGGEELSRQRLVSTSSSTEKRNSLLASRCPCPRAGASCHRTSIRSCNLQRERDPRRIARTVDERSVRLVV